MFYNRTFYIVDVYNHHKTNGSTIAEHLTKEQIAEFQEAFALFDSNGDGTIPVEELETVIEVLGLDQQTDTYEAVIRKVATGKKGRINFPQFLRLTQPLLDETDMEGEVIEAFQVLDNDSSGFISVAMMRNIMSNLEENLTEEEINAFINMADVDSNGMIDYKQFIKRMNFHAPKKRRQKQKDERKEKAKMASEKKSIRKRNRRASYKF